MDEDRRSQKKTLAVRWGWEKARWLLLTEVALALIALAILREMGDEDLFVILLFFFSFAYGLLSSRVRQTRPSPIYNRYLALAGLLLVLFGIAWHVLLVF